MSDLTGARGLLSPHIPFVVSASPDRIAPAHVANGFLASLFGNAPAADPVRRYMRGKDPLPDFVSGAIRHDSEKTAEFREAMRSILDPDHRVFPSGQGSVFPLTLGAVARDRSDDGIGKDVADMLRAGVPEALADFARLLKDGHRRDALHALGQVIGNGHAPALKSPQKVDWPWHERGGRLGRQLSQSLANMVTGSVSLSPELLSTKMAHLTRASYLAGYIGLVRSCSVVAGAPEHWASLAPMFCLGEQPPGDPRTPQCRLAIRSFDAIAAAASDSAEAIIRSRLGNASRGVARSIPPSERARIQVSSAFPELSEKQTEPAAQMIKRIESLDRQARALARHSYPATFFASAIRVTGRMIGMAGPDRGTGSPRFMLETPILALLTRSVAETGSLSYAEWIDRLYERFGIIVGIGRKYDFREMLRDLDDPMPIERALRANHESLRVRLIRAGLAVEYSDSETEVRGRLGDT